MFREKNTPVSDKNIFEPLSGFQIIVHNTDELPFRTGHHFRSKENEGLLAGITPELRLIDSVLETWTPAKRNCFLEGEKKLKYFKIYTKINCEHECLKAAILDACGCVPFYMIRELKTF